MLRVYNVTKTYGAQMALREVSLQAAKGEMVFVAGPSGAGKTTLIKLILCQETNFQGQIVVDGQNLKKMPARKIPYLRRKIGVVFQDFKLIPTRTVFQNVALRLEIEGLRPGHLGKKVRYILKRVGLEGRDQALPPQLSGGEQQRVAIARALVGDPLIILADEPTGNLDVDLSREIVGLIEEINRAGTTVLMATHNREFLENTSHRIIRLDKGRLVA
ncbi:MAG: cell division ATP-binding protein FtsE [Thermodesulfobacteriota bacterium]